MLLVRYDGHVGEYDRVNIECMDLKPEDLWASDYTYDLQRQISQVRRKCPELLQNFKRENGVFSITENTVDAFAEFVLQKGPQTISTAGAIAIAHQDDQGKAMLYNVFCGPLMMATEKELGVKRAYLTSLAHELTHIADRTDYDKVRRSQRYGRYTHSQLFRAIVNFQAAIDSESASAAIRKEVDHYPEDERMFEYLPRLMERYIAPKTFPDSALSELETAYIENVFLPSLSLRNNNKPAHASYLAKQFTKPLSEMGVPVFFCKALLDDAGSFSSQNLLRSNLHRINRELETAVESVIDDAALSYKNAERLSF